MIRAVRSIALFLVFLPIAAVSADGERSYNGLPYGGVNDTAGWCGTQIRFEQELRAIGYDPEASAFACPEYGPCDNPSTRDDWVPEPSTPLVYIRLAIHVLAHSDGSYPFTTPELVQAAVDSVNQHFLSSRIQLVHVFDQVNATEWRVLSESEIDPMKIATAFDPTRYLNVWLTNVLFGYSFATFPFASGAREPTGGIVMGQNHWSGNHSAFAHEIGHCFGLWHIFHGVDEVTRCGPCYEAVNASDRDLLGDLCSDTPPAPAWYECSNAIGVDSCTGLPWGDSQPENLMGYTPIDCRNLFTPQQGGRMRCWIADVLSGWIAVSQESCCQDRVGDANYADISVMVDAKFITGSCFGRIPCLSEADVNQSGGLDPDCDDITMGDISQLIDYLFITGPTLGLAECL